MTPRILFLHGGPGLTAELERRQFGTSLPVHWWDQPRIAPGTEQPFDRLIDAAMAEVERLPQRRRERIGLLASCFGALLARAIVDRMPERIGSVTISGGIADLRTAILRLGGFFARRHRDFELRALCRKTARLSTPESFLALLARVSTTPGFLDCLWGPTANSLRSAAQALASAGELIDWPTLQSVVTAALASAPTLSVAKPDHAPVRILIGRFDPYVDASDADAWKRTWPTATVTIVDAGHFPHLELPPSDWLPQHAVWHTHVIDSTARSPDTSVGASAGRGIL